jgi:hypothetical protein
MGVGLFFLSALGIEKRTRFITTAGLYLSYLFYYNRRNLEHMIPNFSSTGREPATKGQTMLQFLDIIFARFLQR